MKKSIVFAIHTAFWFSYALMLWFVIAASTQGFSKGPHLGYIVKLTIPFVIWPSVSSFYLFYFWVFPVYIKTKKLQLAIVYGIAASLVTALVGMGLLGLLFRNKALLKVDGSTLLQEAAFMFFAALVAGVLSVIINGFITWFTEIKLKEELNLKNHRIEIALVKSQLDPHFLFNTINNIDVLILKSPELASEYLNKLSDILRFILFETKTENISLIKEIEYIQKYIDLQKIRTANDQFVTFSVSAPMAHQTIPSMLLIPFIENAFKHVSNKKVPNAIRIALWVEPQKIIFQCENLYNPHASHQKGSYNGIGHDLIQKRIELLYPEKHNLVIRKNNNLYQVHLELTHE